MWAYIGNQLGLPGHENSLYENAETSFNFAVLEKKLLEQLSKAATIRNCSKQMQITSYTYLYL